MRKMDVLFSVFILEVDGAACFCVGTLQDYQDSTESHRKRKEREKVQGKGSGLHTAACRWTVQNHLWRLSDALGSCVCCASGLLEAEHGEADALVRPPSSRAAEC